MDSRPVQQRPAVLRAELLRWRRSPAHRLVHVAAVYGAVVLAMFALSAMDRSWQTLGNWANIWAVTVGPLYAVLLGATITGMETRTRAGGTLWRRVDPVMARAARVAVLVTHVVAANAMALLVPLLGGVVAGFSGPVPLVRTVTLVGVCGLSQSALAVLAVVLARILGAGWAIAIASGFAMSWMFVRTVETDSWMSWPANWLVRGTIPLTGTHANGTALAAGDPLWNASLWAPALLSLGLAASLASFEPRPLSQWLGRVGRRRAEASSGTERQVQPPSAAAPVRAEALDVSVGDSVRQPSRPGMRGLVSALLVVLRRTAIPWVAPSLFLLGLVFLRWQPARAVTMLLAVIIVPVVASILPILAWSALAPGWRMVGVRRNRFLRPGILVVVLCLVCINGLTALSLAFLATRGLGMDAAIRVWGNCLLLTCFVTPLVSWVTTRVGASVAGALSIFGIIFGVLIGGTGLIARLWPVAPWAWGVLPRGLPILVAAIAAVTMLLLATPMAGRSSVRLALGDN